MTQKEFGELAVTRLGDLVGELKLKGIDGGVSEAEIKEVWKTIFNLMATKMTPKQSREMISKNLKTLLV